ncbi:uncharacterized protein LOC114350489 [Ostrinia furnacalis]|uniref:uncharacterized protein LOC114350489 n=1 Tax=Ostrinia furnacalis TaxID=93504 RepID=UPI001040C73D|nr:uncharacterized protein LOC114350489 [Ostrinia furnacalis]
MNIKADIDSIDIAPINHIINLPIDRIIPPNTTDNEENIQKSQIEEIRKQLETMKQTEPLSDDISNHDIHHYAAIYVVFTVLAAGGAALAWRRWRRRARAPPPQQQQCCVSESVSYSKNGQSSDKAKCSEVKDKPIHSHKSKKDHGTSPVLRSVLTISDDKSRKGGAKAKITEVVEEKDNELQEEAKPKPLIEIVETQDKKPMIEEVEPKSEETSEFIVRTGIEKDGDLIIDHDKKLITNPLKENEPVNNADDKPIDATEETKPSKKVLKKISIEEIPKTESVAVPVTEIPLDSDNQTKDEIKEKDKGNEGSQDNKEEKHEISNVDTKSEERRRSVQYSDGDGVALINYMHRMNTDEGDDEDLEPSAEDLEIFAELDREQEERQARIDRGEPAVDPMKLYDKKTMDAFYKAEERVPAHAVKDKIMYTTYKHDNAFDRIALSQLTAGDRPDEKKVKLTYVPGAVLYEYLDQKPCAELDYEIGEEKVDSGPSSGETESIHILSDTDTNSEDEALELKPKPSTSKSNRPSTAAVRNTNNSQAKTEDKKSPRDDKDKGNHTSAKSGRFVPAGSSQSTPGKREKGEDFKAKKRDGDFKNDPEDRGPDAGIKENDENANVTTDKQDAPKTEALSSSYETMLNVDREEAKQSIINTINSYEDERFPSQGVDRSDMVSDARIEQSVASEILDRTLQYEERSYFQQYDVLTSQAGNIDNKTNAIIEQISDQFDNEYSLPEVSRILEVHMDAAEQRWRAGEFLHYIAVSPAESVADPDDTEVTLVPSHDTSLEDTLTDENVNRMEAITECNDSGIGNEKSIVGDDDDNSTNTDGRANDFPNNDSGVSDTERTDNNGTLSSDERNERDNDSSTNVSSYNKTDEDKDVAEDSSVADDSKIEDYQSVLDESDIGNDKVNDVSTECEEMFEDCEEMGDSNDGKDEFDLISENYSLEMKLALGIHKDL